ncbi:ABC transporter ATP-binding protein [Stackebrandtia soli]|uniref:ABC transporter ATP-binding protein n=1 Tax=Stackebrandtia soli TaxID=1892856 RepID=UPI0039E74D79
MSRILSVVDVTVDIGSERVLDGFSLDVAAGTMLAVTGASGSGKTSLMWTIAGLLTPVAGEIRLGGERLRGRDAAVAAGVSLVPQGNALASVLTARENAIVSLVASGLSANVAAARTDLALDELGVAAQADQLAEELSGGQRQRVAIARALARRGTVFLGDEITSNLDSSNRDRVVKLLRDRADNGMIVVLTTHDDDTIAACDARVHLG